MNQYDELVFIFTGVPIPLALSLAILKIQKQC